MEEHSRNFWVWIDRIRAGTFNKREINQFVYAINSVALGVTQRGKVTFIRQDEAIELCRWCKKIGIRLEDWHQEELLEWLHRHWQTEIRLPKGVVENFSHYTFRGDGYDYRPIFRLHSLDGRMYDYFEVGRQEAIYNRTKKRSKSKPLQGWWPGDENDLELLRPTVFWDR
jgi:hypothetical protein